jgi:hypothetical protein
MFRLNILPVRTHCFVCYSQLHSVYAETISRWETIIQSHTYRDDFCTIIIYYFAETPPSIPLSLTLVRITFLLCSGNVDTNKSSRLLSLDEWNEFFSFYICMFVYIACNMMRMLTGNNILIIWISFMEVARKDHLSNFVVSFILFFFQRQNDKVLN